MSDREAHGADPPTYTAAANAALAASAQVHSEILKMITTGTVPSTDDLKRWKKLNATTNRSISKATRHFWQHEDRLIIERNTIRSCIRKERLDQQANSARVFEKIRQYSTIGQHDTDRMLGNAANVQTMINALAPVQPTSFHGAAWLALDMSANRDGLAHLTAQ